MTKELKPFYIDAEVISDEDVKEICEVVVSLGGRIHEDETFRGDGDLFGLDKFMDTVWYDLPVSYGNAAPIKSMEEFREMFCEPVEGNTQQEAIPITTSPFKELMQQYINIYDQMPTEEDRQYIAQKMEQLCGKYTGDVCWIQMDMSIYKETEG